RVQQEQAHTQELEATDLKHRRDTLVERLREDYQLDIAELYEKEKGKGSQEPAAVPANDLQSGSEEPAPEATPAFNAADANEEIAELRRKLSRLGSVNLDSLQELAEQEARAASLQVQFDDLTSAKHSLEEIISKINQDSRRLFMETFTAIRTHFQELFRKL